MVWRVLNFTGKLCLAVLLLCITFHAMYLAMAYAAERFTDPPACKVSFTFPLPFAVCPGFGFSPEVEYAMALPGAVLTFPFVLPDLLTDPSSALQLFVLLPALLHVFAWGYLIAALLSRLLPRRRR